MQSLFKPASLWLRFDIVLTSLWPRLDRAATPLGFTLFFLLFSFPKSCLQSSQNMRALRFFVIAILASLADCQGVFFFVPFFYFLLIMLAYLVVPEMSLLLHTPHRHVTQIQTVLIPFLKSLPFFRFGTASDRLWLLLDHMEWRSLVGRGRMRGGWLQGIWWNAGN